MKKNTKNEWEVPKTLFSVFFFCLVFLFVCYTYISLSPKVFGINISKFALTRNTYETVLKSKRGTIFDSENNTLALNVYSYTVIAYLEPSRTVDDSKPKHVIDPVMTAEALSPLLNMSVKDLTNLLTLKNRYQVELGPGGRYITELKKEEIEKLNLPGIDFIETSKRFYPNGDFASYIIGYAKANEHTTDGKVELVIDGELGVEAKYDEMLKGTNGYLKYQQDAKGYQIPETKEERVDALDGNEIYLTINSTIQRFLEETMDEAESKYKYDWFQIHIMDAKTGDIVASSSSPSFDPNIREIVNYENNLTSVLIEPGSVMKTFTYLCAMEKGTYDGSKTFKSGKIEVEDTTISDWNNVGWGTITYDYGYEQSSNVGITNMLLNDNFINANDLKECFTKYGFGDYTGVELNEAKGKVEFYYPVEIATAGFGQGIFVTPIQILEAYSIIANNGKMLKPHLINKIVNPNTGEIVYQRKVEMSNTLVSMENITKIKNLMYNVVNSETGSGRGYSTLNYGIKLIGKTGTAEIYEKGGYLKNQYIRSFAGMFPFEDPKYVIYAAVKKVNPDSNTIITSSVKEVVKKISKYYNISDSISLTSYEIDNYNSRNVKEVLDNLKLLGIDTYVIGDGDYIINQYPREGEILKGEKIFLLTNGGNYKMPNMIGWSKSEVLSYLKLINLTPTFEGIGYVKTQNITKNSFIDGEIILKLDEIYEKE